MTSRGVRLHAAATEAGFTATLRVGDVSSLSGQSRTRRQSRLNAEQRLGLDAIRATWRKQDARGHA